ncbi:hypothetical protein [Campylobacter hyointestinalis]|uniref:Uncharacterized protein n=1 Tax=Campylobacter hyointestinalis subsp. lawsonii TaxID=91353 RepID=A0AAV6EJG8_CAMHY|nr:hypothetical protein [Campylobacter hyointestinalis]KAB0613748.1 hypothetical protein F7P66_03510 [Campylobacter hyointestinalis subsp. lawsonii]QKF70291.1 putative membrane protein [Campylobacter hyointestinalis subsp. lawsonii]RAZ29226.1 hypothetical protein CHLT_02025 [Campylobacter hyointestinalis subsp. lawsonii]RAZ49605.1 hypothetical protein CHL9004_05785 [Campylobacter hyointestinalis subsp. lawsonii]RAZ51278.1 hypothetical protein CHL10075_07835 [Campylobacter hyointestinalis subsp
MSKLDEKKERLGLLKFWLGVIVGSFLANVAWLATNYNKTENLIIVGSILAIIFLAVSFVFINKKIAKILKEIGDL